MREPGVVTERPSDELRLPAGAVLFQQGDAGDEMYVIERGRVRLSLGTGDPGEELAVLGPGDFFGELSLLGRAPRTATAVAVEDALLLVIRRDTFALMMQDDLEVVFRMMDVLGRRLVQADEQVHRLVERLQRVRAVADRIARCLAGGEPGASVDLGELARLLEALRAAAG